MDVLAFDLCDDCVGWALLRDDGSREESEGLAHWIFMDSAEKDSKTKAG